MRILQKQRDGCLVEAEFRGTWLPNTSCRFSQTQDNVTLPAVFSSRHFRAVSKSMDWTLSETLERRMENSFLGAYF